MKKKNLIGRQVSRLRYQRGWTQDRLADKLQLAGWMISRSGVSKIEGGAIYVPDFRLFYFARVFKVEITALFSKAGHESVIHDQAMQHGCDEKRAAASCGNILVAQQRR